ncbi:MAG: type II toxin-antitoxin system VapC family toxin [Thiobacillus sp.]|nr:type II toxin-antitoxin system VapC family toxin [Thiobacillus sp.]
MSDAGLVIDTHVWLWIEADPDRLGKAARARIDAAARAGSLWVSVMSVWEIGMLVAKDRIRLAMPVDEWVRQASATPGMQMLGLIPDIALESTRLPDAPHGDPVDRMLIASARVHNLTLVTADEKILAYAALGHLKALQA